MHGQGRVHVAKRSFLCKILYASKFEWRLRERRHGAHIWQVVSSRQRCSTVQLSELDIRKPHGPDIEHRASHPWSCAPPAASPAAYACTALFELSSLRRSLHVHARGDSGRPRGPLQARRSLRVRAGGVDAELTACRPTRRAATQKLQARAFALGQLARWEGLGCDASE